MADLKINIRERQESMERLNKFRMKDDAGVSGDFDWANGDTRSEINAFVEFISEEMEDGRRKMVDLWDHYSIARDSSHKWNTVVQCKRPKTFEHGADNVPPVHKLQELSLEEKAEKLKKAERDAKYKLAKPPLEGRLRDMGESTPPASHPPIGIR